MPPKRKRAEADSAVEGSATRSTRKSSRVARGKGGTVDVNGKADSLNSVEPLHKKARAKSRKGPLSRDTNATRPIDDQVPLDSTTSQQQSVDGPDVSKQAAAVSTRLEYSQHRAQALFKSFTDDDDPDVIGPEGVESLCKEAGIPLEGGQPLILAWQFNAREMAKLSRSEWLQGTEALRISSLPAFAVMLKELDDLVIWDKEPIMSESTAEKRDSVGSQQAYSRDRYSRYALDRNAAFSELYQFCFSLSKPTQSRNIDIETAMALWSVLLASRYPNIAELIEFLNSGSYKAVNKDIWNMVHEFCRTVNEELSNYETDGAWPTMLDDFVDWKRDRMPRSTDKSALTDD